jgi:hypothetical protein
VRSPTGICAPPDLSLDRSVPRSLRPSIAPSLDRSVPRSLRPSIAPSLDRSRRFPRSAPLWLLGFGPAATPSGELAHLEMPPPGDRSTIDRWAALPSPPGGAMSRSANRPRFSKAYSFGIITGLLFLLSWIGQFVFQVAEVSNEAAEHGSAFQWSDFWPQFFAATFENWQSEFLQLVWASRRTGPLLLLGLIPVEGGRRTTRSQDRPPAHRARDRPGRVRVSRGTEGRSRAASLILSAGAPTHAVGSSQGLKGKRVLSVLSRRSVSSSPAGTGLGHT